MLESRSLEARVGEMLTEHRRKSGPSLSASHPQSISKKSQSTVGLPVLDMNNVIGAFVEETLKELKRRSLLIGPVGAYSAALTAALQVNELADGELTVEQHEQLKAQHGRSALVREQREFDERRRTRADSTHASVVERRRAEADRVAREAEQEETRRIQQEAERRLGRDL